jgi:hypothetical protein
MLQNTCVRVCCKLHVANACVRVLHLHLVLDSNVLYDSQSLGCVGAYVCLVLPTARGCCVRLGPDMSSLLSIDWFLNSVRCCW